MIERKFVEQELREFGVEEYISKELARAGVSHAQIHRTPLGEKIIIFASRPGIIVGTSGKSIKKLTNDLKKKFNFENPQIEIQEVKDPNINARIVAEQIAQYLRKFGSMRFKSIGYKSMTRSIEAGAIGIEILMSGKIPGARAKRWRFYQGYLKKCGDVSVSGVLKAYTTATLKSGMVGIQVRIMPPGLVLPDKFEMYDEPITIVEEEDIDAKAKKGKKKSTKKKKAKKTTVKKTKAKVTDKKESDGAVSEETTATKESTDNSDKEEKPSSSERKETPISE